MKNLYLQVHRHDHSYVDTMLQSDSCYSGWTQDEDMKKYNEWENDGGDPDPNCYKRKRTGSYGDDETRPKNIRVIYIMKIYWYLYPWLPQQQNVQ